MHEGQSNLRQGRHRPPQDTDVPLRMVNLSDKRIAVPAGLIGAPGTIDAPSWSPGGRRVAFVSYHRIPAPWIS